MGSMLKNSLLTIGIIGTMAFLFSFTNKYTANTVYEYRTMTTVESLIEGGAGRSKLMTNIDKYEEKKMLNMYSLVGINFKNLASNDYQITEELSKLSLEGWELVNVTSAVHSQSQKGTYEEVTNSGIFLTRYLLRKPIR